MPIADDAPAAHHPNAIRQAEDLIEIVADDQYSQPLPFHFENHVFDRLGFRDPERRCRFVHKNEARTPGAGARDRYDLALAAGQQFDRLAIGGMLRMKRLSISPVLKIMARLSSM